MAEYDLTIRSNRLNDQVPCIQIGGDFKRHGFVEWKPGLTLGHLPAIEYRQTARRVCIIRDGVSIYETDLVETAHFGGERERKASDATPLLPNDVIFARGREACM